MRCGWGSTSSCAGPVESGIRIPRTMGLEGPSGDGDTDRRCIRHPETGARGQRERGACRQREARQTNGRGLVREQT